MTTRSPFLERGAAEALLRQAAAPRGVAPLARAAPHDEPPGRIEAGPPGVGVREPVLIHEPGGDVLRRLEHPAFTTLERMQRVGPPANGSWFNPNISTQSSVQVELLSFQVPRGQQAWVFDYSFSLYRQSGVDPGDLVKAEDGRFSSCLGFDVTLDGQRVGAIQYGLVPVPQGTPLVRSTNLLAAPTQPIYQGAPQFGGPAQQGLSLLPARETVAGARGAPFTLIANEGQRVTLTCVIFRRLRAAVGAIEGRLGGYLLATNFAQSLTNRLRPR